MRVRRKRLNDFLAEQTAANEANKRRAREHADNAVAMADFAIKTLQDHVANRSPRWKRQQRLKPMRTPDLFRQRRFRRRRKLGPAHGPRREEAAEADERPVSRNDPITSAPRSDNAMLQSRSLRAIMDIVVWLGSLGLGKYEAVFRKNDTLFISDIGTRRLNAVNSYSSQRSPNGYGPRGRP